VPTVCVQCALRALVAGEPAPVWDEEPEVHQQRMHPDLEATARERRELEAILERRRQHEDEQA